MSSKSKHPRPNMHRCADCGKHNAVVHTGFWPNKEWICLKCQRKRNDQLDEIVRTSGALVMQPIDPDSPPMQCGCRDCSADATYITKINNGDGLMGITACDKHIEDMTQAVSKMVGEPLQTMDFDKMVRQQRRGPDVYRQRVGILVEPGEDLITAIKRSRQCPDCDSVVDIDEAASGGIEVHVTHGPTCPRLAAWGHKHGNGQP
jgi:hypothetical protein